ELVGEPVGASVDDVGDDDVVPRLEESEHHRHGGGHARPVGGGVGPALQGGDLLLEGADGGVAAAGVAVALRHVLVDRVLHEGGRLVDRGEDRSGHRVGGDAGVDLVGTETHGPIVAPGVGCR